MLIPFYVKLTFKTVFLLSCLCNVKVMACCIAGYFWKEQILTFHVVQYMIRLLCRVESNVAVWFFQVNQETS